MMITLNRSKGGYEPKPRHSFWRGIANMFAVRRQRRMLLELDKHLLNDIGVTQVDAAIEAEKPVWDLPSYWSK